VLLCVSALARPQTPHPVHNGHGVLKLLPCHAAIVTPTTTATHRSGYRRQLLHLSSLLCRYSFRPQAERSGCQLIPCWDEKTLNLSFQGKHFTWTFLLAAVSFPIIGADFLRHFNLMVDTAANALVDKCSAESFALTAAASADSGPPPAAQLTGPQSPVISHRSSVTGPQSPVISHRSSVTGPQSPVLSHLSTVTGHQ
jgi:hypothetical protein